MTDGKFSLDHDKCPHCGESVYNGEHEIIDGQWSCPDVLVIEDLEPVVRDKIIKRFGLR